MKYFRFYKLIMPVHVVRSHFIQTQIFQAVFGNFGVFWQLLAKKYAHVDPSYALKLEVFTTLMDRHIPFY